MTATVWCCMTFTKGFGVSILVAWAEVDKAALLYRDAEDDDRGVVVVGGVVDEITDVVGPEMVETK